MGDSPLNRAMQMRRFPFFFLGFAWHVRTCVHNFFSSCHQVKPCIMPSTRIEYHGSPGQYKRSVLSFFAR